MKRSIFIFVSLFLLITTHLIAFTFEERVAAQRAIEHVYYNHRIWPSQNPGPKPPLDVILPEASLQAKVEDYLRKSNALEFYWQRPITAQQLQAEMDRMARETKQPAVLRELFAALNNDAQLIAECLARPILADRLIHNWYAYDERFHGDLKHRAESELVLANTVEAMPTLGGEYRESEWTRQRVNAPASAPGAPDVVPLEDHQWNRLLQRLEDHFAVNTPAELPLRILSRLQEGETSFFVVAVLEKDDMYIKLATMDWPKQGFDRWWSEVDRQLRADIAAPTATYSLSQLQTPHCMPDTWSPTAWSVPEARMDQTAIWTGSEMIIWGGDAGYGWGMYTGGRYDPATDTWQPTELKVPHSSPDMRQWHSAVWTGTEMIIWGGYVPDMYYNDGSRYNPTTNTWIRMTWSPNTPSERCYHRAIWTGSEMIIWGGWDGLTYFNNGGRYSPSSDTWQPVSIGANVPSPRIGHTSIWTGSRMVVWGGYDGNVLFNTGGLYDPVSDTWQPTSTGTNVPFPRVVHTAVWTGSEMIVWGGYTGVIYLNTGARYNPVSDTWTSTSMANVPAGRWYHTAIWTGTEMIIWGGSSASIYFNSGGRYNPQNDTWSATSGATAPSPRDTHTAVWTGTEMIVWGGWNGSTYFNTGGRYNPTMNSWVSTGMGTLNVPAGRGYHTAVWTGAEMILWGGSGLPFLTFNTGGRFDPATDTWLPTSTGTNVPGKRFSHTAVWSGTEMIIWGGWDWNLGEIYNSGARYNPTTNTWQPTSTGTNVPEKRYGHAAVWTGTKMIVWGGFNNTAYLNTGGRYDPAANTWVPTSTGANVPSARFTRAVWSGTEMILWGGRNGSVFFNNGGRYDPTADTWLPTSTGTNVPEKRSGHSAVWTGTKMIVWGGLDGSVYLNTGGRYDPTVDTWLPTSTGANVPAARDSQVDIWTGTEMIVWGGYTDTAVVNTGGRYNPTTDSWIPTSTGTKTASPRVGHSAVWTGHQMIIWGGEEEAYDDFVNTGACYCVTPLNSPPVADDQPVNTNEDTSKSVVLTATDADSDPLTYMVISSPSHGTLSGSPPNLTYVPNANYNGADSFTFKANDGFVDSNIATVSITVNAVNDPPIANGQSVSTNEDIPLNIILTASDADGDVLTFMIISTPTHGVLTGAAPNVTYTPNPNYNGPDSFTFKANDGTADSNIATASITVSPVNDPPVANNQSLSTSQDAPVAVVLTASDVEGNTLTFFVVSFPMHGSLAGSPPNLTYSPNTGYNGPDSFTFKANDGTVDSNIATISITVNAVNHSPIAVDDTATTLRDTPVQINVVANDSDPDGDPLAVISVSQGTHGSVVNNSDGTVTFTPNPGFTGADNFAYTIGDGHGGVATANVNVTVVLPSLFGDDFEDGVLASDWTYLKPSWSETGGNLVATPTRKAVAVASPAFSGCQVCSVEAQMKTAGGIGNILWLLGWYVDKNNTMELLLKEQNDKIILKQRAGGAIVKKQGVKITIDPNIFYDIKITFTGAQFDVLVDSVNVMTFVPVGDIPTGTIGFQAKKTVGSFGSINVQ